MEVGAQRLHAVDKADPRLHAVIPGQAVVLIETKPKIRREVSELDEVLAEECYLLDVGRSLKGVDTPTACQVNGQQAGQECFVRRQSEGRALRWICGGGVRRWGSFPVEARTIEPCIGEPSGKLFRQEGVLELDAAGRVMAPLTISQLIAKSGIGKPASLLEVGRRIGKNIIGGAISDLVLPYPKVRLMEGVSIEGMQHLRGNVEADHGLSLVLAQRLLIVRVRRLEPGAAQTGVELEIYLIGGSVVEPLNQILCVP